MWLLDTNTLIYFFKGQGRVAEQLLAQPPGDVVIPTLVLYELHTGIAKSTQPQKRRQQLQDLCELVQLLPFDEACALAAAALRAKLEKAGQPIGPIDTLIAGSAMAYQHTLVTHNQNEFRRVRGLKLIDWY